MCCVLVSDLSRESCEQNNGAVTAGSITAPLLAISA